MAIATLIIGLLLFVGMLSYLIYFQHSFTKDRLALSLSKKQWILFFGSITLLSTGLMLTGLALFLFHPEWSTSRAKYLSLFIIGLFFFAFFLSLLISGFIFHYYKIKMEPKTKKIFSYCLWGSIPFVIIFFLMFMEGIAPFQSYPLVMGFKIGSKGFEWTKAGSGAYSGEFHVAWYGLIILCGVALAYFISDHKFYQEFHKHGLLDSLVLWAFPAGVIGARIWYVVGNWDRQFAGRDWTDVFKVWDGGLTILGGAFAGILVGYLFIRIRRKYIDPRLAMDICVPTVLLAQAVGRWGNFFNCEVYGKVVNVSEGWSWLPTWIINQMQINNNGTSLAAGQINAPLFLVEGILSVIGYFVIVYGVGKGLKKFIVRGDLAGCYFLWYGIVRIIMEPMRNSEFNMGSDNAWSVANSLIYIILGLAIILFAHLHDYYQEKAHKDYVIPLFATCLGVAACLFPLLPSLSAGEVLSETTVQQIKVYGGFEVIFGSSSALLVAYIFLLIGTVLLGVSVLLSALKQDKIKKICLIISSSLMLVSAIMFFMGANWNTLSRTYDSHEVTFSLSYGFVLLAAFSLWGSVIGASYFLAERDFKKKEAIESV